MDSRRILTATNRMRPPAHLPPAGASWILPHASFAVPGAFAARLRFQLKSKTRLSFHVTSDERHILFLDGHRIGCGPERGDARNWFCSFHELSLAPGSHTLVAQVWALGGQGPAAQTCVMPGFYFAAEGAQANLWNTGQAPWEMKILHGYSWPDLGGRSHLYHAVGRDLEINGGCFDWGFEKGWGKGWKIAIPGERPQPSTSPYGHPSSGHRLRPAPLPPMAGARVLRGSVRHIEIFSACPRSNRPVRILRHRTDLAPSWQSFLQGRGIITIPPRSHIRIIIDLEDYYCAYPALRASGGSGSRITLRWAEALFHNQEATIKGNRNEIEAKYFVGMGDRFLTDGGKHRTFETLWWRAGRYIQFEISTANNPLVLDNFSLRETRYPLEPESSFHSDEPRLEAAHRICLRGLQMCAHETYMDCPYYEQLMYIGDTRLSMLTHYTLCRDDRLQRKSLEMFDESRKFGDGLTLSCYPSRIRQLIPPFSLWWIAAIHDHALWRGGADFLRDRMPGIRAVLEHWLAHCGEDGLVRSPQGWNLTDWVPGWDRGVSPQGDHGPCGVLNWHLAHVLGLAAGLESWCDEHELATRNRRLAATLAHNTSAAFWSAERGLFADDLQHRMFSQHAQCLATLSGLVPAAQLRVLRRTLPAARNMAPASIYFSHYLLETYRTLGLENPFHRKLSDWFSLEEQGFKTPPEESEPSRSDCHAWGSHPLFHSYASILGIRPSAPGFQRVEIRPLPGPLRDLSGRMPHPNGFIDVEYTRKNKMIYAQVTLPGSIKGEFHWKGQTRLLRPGSQSLKL